MSEQIDHNVDYEISQRFHLIEKGTIHLFLSRLRYIWPLHNVRND